MSCDSEEENSCELGVDDLELQEMEDADDQAVDVSKIVELYTDLRNEYGKEIVEHALKGLDKRSFEMLQYVGIVETLPKGYKESEDHSMELIQRFNERCS